MLKKLRLKIILAIVLVAAVMLGAILGLFYTLTKQNLRTQSISMMQAIAADPFSPVQPGQEPQQVPPAVFRAADRRIRQSGCHRVKRLRSDRPGVFADGRRRGAGFTGRHR